MLYSIILIALLEKCRCYKPHTLQAQRELKNRKRKKHRTENNEAESSVLVEQDRR